MAQITGRSVRDEASQPTLCAVQWVRTKRAKWLGHILRENELSLVKTAVLTSFARGEVGTLMDEAPPHRSISHLCAIASKRDGAWEDWCKTLQRTICPDKYDGLADPEIRRSLRRGPRRTYDPVPPVITVPPPRCYPDRGAVPRATSSGSRNQRWDAIFAEALAEVQDRDTYDPTKPTDLYTDGSCTDNGRPFAAAGWGVHVHNSDQLSEYFGALPGQVQTNNRAELAAVEAALQLAWASTHSHCRVLADCGLACMGIANTSDEWAWRSALGLKGWLHRWERNGWHSASGGRVRHADIWQHIIRWLRLFEGDPNRRVEVLHVKAHAGTHGNERADKLAAEGSALRFQLMEDAAPQNWFQNALEKYWGNRAPS